MTSPTALDDELLRLAEKASGPDGNSKCPDCGGSVSLENALLVDGKTLVHAACLWGNA